MNGLKTALLLGLLSSVLVLGGGAIAGRQGIWLGLAFAVAMNFFSYFFSEKIALTAHGAQPLTPETAPGLYQRLYGMTSEISGRMGIPTPKLWLLPEASPNAFATGRNPENASVAVTEGLLNLMDDEEVQGVIAHELAHVKNRDILISSIAATIGGAITAIAQFGLFFGGSRDDDDEVGSPAVALLMLFVGPIAAGLIQMAVSRTREFAADESAARAIGSPYGLANALRKLEGWSKRIPLHTNAASAHMFIIKPFTGESFARLFSTHPSTEERIERLESLAVSSRSVARV